MIWAQYKGTSGNSDRLALIGEVISPSWKDNSFAQIHDIMNNDLGRHLTMTGTKESTKENENSRKQTHYLVSGYMVQRDG